MSQLWLVLPAAANGCVGHGAGLSVQRREALPALAARPWHALAVSPGLGSGEGTGTGPFSPVWVSRWAGPAYPWQGSRMLGMERLSCLAESLAWEGWHVWTAGALGISTGQPPSCLVSPVHL